MREPASFAFLVGHSTVEEYHQQRAKNVVADMLTETERRLIRAGSGAAHALMLFRSFCSQHFSKLEEW